MRRSWKSSKSWMAGLKLLNSYLIWYPLNNTSVYMQSSTTTQYKKITPIIFFSSFAYFSGPPDIDVLWCISFQVTQLSIPVVLERPTVNTNFLSNATLKSLATMRPFSLSGRYPVRLVPWYLWPGFGCSGWKYIK